MSEFKKFEAERLVDLSAWGYEKPGRVRRLSYGQMKAMQRELDALARSDAEDKDEMAVIITLRYCLVDSPKGTDERELETLDWEALAYLAVQAQEHNSPLVMRPASASATDTSTGPATRSS